MARGSKISRESLLEAAERLVQEKGSAALTIGALAMEAGVSKGGVQAMFGTKEALILSLVRHWLDREQTEFRTKLEAQPNADPTMLHIAQTQRLDDASHAKIAALLALASHSPQHSGIAQDWYAERANGFRAETDAERQKRLAFLATEGVYFLRFLVGVRFDEAAWEDIFRDIRALSSADHE